MSDEDTPDLWQVIDAAIGSFAERMETGLPGVFTSYDADSNRASVIALVMTGVIGEDGSRVGTPIASFTDVPVALFGAGKIRIKIPIKKGDECWLNFSSRALTAWKQNGTKVSDPLDDRKHHRADVTAVPVVFINPQDSDTMIEFTEDGQILVGGDQPLATKADLQDLKDAISGAAVLANDGGATFKANILTALGAAGFPVGTNKIKGS